MLINVIKQNTMKQLLDLIESQQSRAIMTTLHCQLSLAPRIKIDQDDMVLALKDAIGEYHSYIYICHDGDMFIVWQGGSLKTINAVKQGIIQQYPEIFEELPEDMFFRYFDIRAHGEELRIACRKKIDEEKKCHSTGICINNERIASIHEQKDLDELKSIKDDDAIKTEFVVKIIDKKYIQVEDDFFNLYKIAEPLRRKRRKPKFLVIEDQSFASRLLARVIADNGEPIIAATGEDGLFMYAMYAPDIAFIDINLPDTSGHILAEFIRQLDKNAFIVMVSANHSDKDVEYASRNDVQGYMIKPYTLKKVKEVLDNFYRGKKYEQHH